MVPQQNFRVPNDIKFRVLIIGRANAGKTTILQRMGGGTKIYRLGGPWGKPKRVKFHPTTERGLHNIEDEIVFKGHDGYIFHDSRGIEAGGEDELKVVQEFVVRKMREKRLKNRLHAIWYCIPTDKIARSMQDIKFFGNICQDTSVPVIAVFTKYEEFKRQVQIDLDDQPGDVKTPLDVEVERVFEENYLGKLTKIFEEKHLGKLKGPPPFVCLEKMHKLGARCEDLVIQTANALSSDAVALMLMAVQRGNLGLSINQAVRK